jgi:phage gp36-like protein
MVYSTVARTRELSGLTDTVFHNMSGTSTEVILNRDFIEITQILVNGVVNTDYTATRPRKIVFDTALHSHDIVQVDMDIFFTDAQVTTFIEESDAIIDSYLNDVFTTPFSPVPAIIAMVSAQLSAARILLAIGAKLNRVDANEFASALRSQALETIGLLQKGELSISGIDSGSRTSINVSTKGKKKVFDTRPDLNETWHEFNDGFDRDEGQDYGNGDLQSS